MKKILLLFLIFKNISAFLYEYPLYDFEKGIQNWEEGKYFKRQKISGNYLPQSAYSGSYVIGLPSEDKSYDDLGVYFSDAIRSPEFNLTGYQKCYITFWHWADFEDSNSFGHFDGGGIAISVKNKFLPDEDSYNLWKLIDPTDFKEKDSFKYSFPLPPKGHLMPSYPDFVNNTINNNTFHLQYLYSVDTAGESFGGKWIKVISCDLIAAGYCQPNDIIKFEFRFICNENKKGGKGWYIDDFKLTYQDIAPPVISNITQLANTFFRGPYEISAEVIDDTEIKEVNLYYCFNNGQWNKVKMTSFLNNIFKATIPEVNNNTTVKYYITSQDSINKEINQRPIPYYSFNVLPSLSKDILLVNDDPSFGRRCEKDYKEALEEALEALKKERNLNYDYDYIWNNDTGKNTPTGKDLKHYKIVIWYTAIQGGKKTFTLPSDTEPNLNPLTKEEQSALKEYLNSSTPQDVKKLFLTGQCILKGIEEEFKTNYLHISNSEETFMPLTLTGTHFLTGKFVEITFESRFFWPYDDAFKPYKITPTEESLPILQNNKTKEIFGVIYFKNKKEKNPYKLILLSFDFSFIEKKDLEKNILKEIINFFSPPPTPFYIKAKAFDKKVLLSWNFPGDTYWLRGFNILRKDLQNNDEYQQIAFLKADENEFIDSSDIKNNNLYGYKIIAEDFAYEKSEFLEEIKVKPGSLPFAPSILKIEKENSKAKLSWIKVEEAKGYYIYRRQINSSLWIKIGETENLYFIDENIYSNIKYSYVVTSHQSEVKNKIIGPESNYSDAISFVLEDILKEAKKNLKNVIVYPNPANYKIKFINLTERAKIYIYTLAGELVDLIEHYNNSGEEIFSLNKIKSGIYIYLIEAYDNLDRKIITKGKFAVIK